MAAAYPRVVKNYNLFIDGSGWAGRVDEVTLPALNFVTEEHRAGGMDGSIEIEMGMEAMTATIVISDFGPEFFRQLGLMNNNNLQITLRAAVQAQGDAMKKWVFAMRGGWKGLEFAAMTPGAKSPLTLTGALTYFRADYEGRTEFEFEPMGPTRVVNGVDQLAGMRDILGL